MDPTPNVTPGVETSELAVANNAKLWGIVALVLGAVIALASMFAEQGGKAGAVAGIVLGIAGAIQTTLVSLGYVRSRTDVKVAASNAAAAASANAPPAANASPPASTGNALTGRLAQPPP